MVVVLMGAVWFLYFKQTYQSNIAVLYLQINFLVNAVSIHLIIIDIS